MFHWFNSIDPTLQGVVIGSTLSIIGTTLGVALTNLYNFWALTRQQTHERTQKMVERAATLRRTVYLDAAEALGAGLNLIARQGWLGLTDAELAEPYHTRQPTLARVYLTAREETALALAEYTAAFQTALVPLTLKRNKAMAMRANILELRAKRAAQIELANEMEDKQKQWFIDGQNDQKKYDAYGYALEYHQKRAAEFARRAEEETKRLQLVHFDLFDNAQKANLALAKKLMPFVVEMRKELESPIDQQRFEAIFQHAKPMPQEQLKELLGIQE